MGTHGHAVLEVVLLEGEQVEGYLPVLGKTGETGIEGLLPAVLVHHREGRGEGVGREGDRAHHTLGGGPAGMHQHLAALVDSLVELRLALGAHRGERGRDLEREVLGHGVEEAGVLAAHGMDAVPAHLEDGDDMVAEPDGHADEAREGREQPRGDLVPTRARLLDHPSARRGPRPERRRVGRLDAQAEGMARLRGERRHAEAVGKELRDVRAPERGGEPAEPEAVVLGQVDDGPRSLHRVAELLEDVPEERAHVLGVERAQDDLERAGEAVVRLGELVDEPLPLEGGTALLVEGPRDQEVGVARGAHAVASHRDGDVGSVGHPTSQGDHGAIGGEREPALGGRTHDRREEVGDAGPHEVARGHAQEPARLPVGEQHGAIAVEDEDGVGGEGQEPREGAGDAPLPYPVDAPDRVGRHAPSIGKTGP
jgi:hypothetical protein